MSTALPYRPRLAGSSLLALAALLASVPAHAQTPPPPPPAASTIALKPVIITARHRAERAQSVPVSLTVVSADQIKTVGSSNLAKLQELVPTLTVEAFNPRNTALNIRGLGAVPNLANDGLEDGVGVYLDGVLLARPAQAVFDLPDIQEIEVLRGPQGTLFGKNTVSGAVNITTALPSFTPTAEFSVSGGSQNYLQLKARVSSTLFGSDKLAFSLLYQGTQHAGYEHDLYDGRRFGDQNDKGLRAQLLANITPALTVRTILDFSDEDNNCCANQIFGYVNNYAPGYLGGSALPAAKTAQAHYAAIGYPLPVANAWARATTDNSPVHYHQQTGGISTQADYDLDGFVLSSISAVRYWDWFPHNDNDLSSLSIMTQGQATVTQRQASQELRVTSPTGGPVDYTAGLYYFYQELTSNTVITYGPDAGAWLADAAVGSPAAAAYNTALDGLSGASNGLYFTNSYAAYGQATWHILPQLDLTGGLRYTYEEKTGTFNAVQDYANPTGSAALEGKFAPIVPPYKVDANNGLPAGLITLSYKPTEGVLVYGTYSHGAKSAGINLIANTALPRVVQPETLDNFEVGAKTTLLDGRVLLDGDLFWDEDTDYQATLISYVGGTPYTYVSSIPKVRSRGAEVDAQAQVTQGLSVFASAVYDNAYYEKNPSAPCPIELGGTSVSCNLTGGRVPGVSTWTGSIGGEYEQPLPPVGNQQLVAYVGVDASLRNGFFSGADNSQYSWVPGYGIGNVSFGVKQAEGRWDLSGWIHNFTDSHYYLYRGASGSFPTYNTVSGLVGDPITGGVTLTGKF
jgi:iron complex outermembrane receptor protein